MLLKTKQLLGATLNSLGEAVFVVDPDERSIVLCNAAVESVFGYTPDELLGRSTEILHVDRESFERFAQHSEPILEQNGVFHTEYTMKRKDGTVIYTENAVTEISKEAGWGSGVVSMVRDITEQKRTQHPMQELNERLQAVIHSSPAAIIALDVEDNIMLWSPTAQGRYAHRRQPVICSSARRRDFVLQTSMHFSGMLILHTDIPVHSWHPGGRTVQEQVYSLLVVEDNAGDARLIEFLRPALDIPHSHHEKWDGSGYPRGLNGEEIPLAARIFAVVDVYDALTSDRPYRDAWSEQEALTYIREQAGKHFDPDVVEVFLRLREHPAST